jgi:hypothetical protein
MESIVIAVDTVMYMEAVHMDIAGLDDSNAVICASKQVDVADTEILAAVKKKRVWPAISTESTRGRCTASRRMKLLALAVDCAWALHSYILCVDCEDEGPVAVVQGRIAAERDGVYGMILFSIGAAQQLARCRNVQSDIALEFESADMKIARRHKNCSAAIPMAGVDGCLDRQRINCGAVAFRAVIPDVVDAGTQVISDRSSLCGLRV